MDDFNHLIQEREDMSKKIHKLANLFYEYMPNFYRYINPIMNYENSAKYKLSENQIKVLMCVYINKSNTPTEISELTYIHKGSLTVIVRSLLKLDFLEKIIAPSDERSYRLQVTKAGLDFITYKQGVVEAELAELFKGMEKEDIKKVIEGLEILNRHFNSNK